MKGDFTKFSYDPTRHYSRVRMQQGRVQLDADWNEQADIQANLIQTMTQDFLGGSAAPQAGGGFGISLVNGAPQIMPGRLYAGGLLCVLEVPTGATTVPFTGQPDYPGATLPAFNSAQFTTPSTSPTPSANVYLAYLDAWQQHVTAVEDPTLSEVALGGADTSTRIKNVSQVKLWPLTSDGTAGPPVQPVSASDWSAATAPSGGLMAAQTATSASYTGTQIAAYTGAENQLYRVEIHAVDASGNVTFKWSRDNGSVVAAATLSPAGATTQGATTQSITLATPSRDDVLGWAVGQWIEISTVANELNPPAYTGAGTLAQITAVSGLVLTISALTGGPYVSSSALTVRVRRWDGATLGTFPQGSQTAWLPLESGIYVQFSGGPFHAGDYWTLPARTLTQSIVWPANSSNLPVAQSPQGIVHAYVQLAKLYLTATGWVLGQNLLATFPTLQQSSLLALKADTQNNVTVLGNLTSDGNLTTLGSATIGSTTTPQPLTVTGALTAASATVNNALSAGSATVTHALSAGSATVNNALSAGSATVNNALSAGSATVTNALTAGSATVTGALTAKGGVSVTGGLTTSGNVGIGTASPQQTLSVQGGLNIDQAAANTGALAGGINALTFGSSSGEGIGSQRTSSGSSIQYGLDFYTDNALRMHIANNGFVGIATNLPAVPLDVVMATSYTVTNGYGWLNSGGSGSGSSGSGSVQFSARFSGRVAASEFDATSDAREKRVLDHMQPEDALRALGGVDVVRYAWLYRGGLPKWGVVAQQLGPHVPEAVTVGRGKINGEPVDDFHTVDYAQLTALSLSAIQGLDARTQALSAEVSRLHGENAALREENESTKARLSRVEAAMAELGGRPGPGR